jgi:hypothetical protein
VAEELGGVLGQGDPGILEDVPGRRGSRSFREVKDDRNGRSLQTAGSLAGGRKGRPAIGEDLEAVFQAHLTLGLGGRAIRDRDQIPRHFLTRHPDLQAWMTIPAASRAAELTRTGAWPLVCFAIGTGRLWLDLDLAGIKQLTGLGRAVEDRDPAASPWHGRRSCGWAGHQPGWKSSWLSAWPCCSPGTPARPPPLTAESAAQRQ